MSTLDEVYPRSPQLAVPDELTRPSRRYQRHALQATVGVLAFAFVYLGLTGYFGWLVWRLWTGAFLHGGNAVAAFFLSLPPLFFFAFMVRGLFAVKTSGKDQLVELKPESEPLLFAFLDRLAQETRSPRPRRVYVSARVNAAVFYDLSFKNLLFPSQKNLELGLGLVNVLTLDELKAVIAHELGHFAQSTMAVGRWVYLAEQIAGHIVASRGIFDRFLAGISRIDLRLAWIGWLLRLLVWALRAVLDTCFRVVVLAHRALSREMEFQADRVAVAVSGSDSLVHALHRLRGADEAWDLAANFAVGEASGGRKVPDLFEYQDVALRHLRRVLDEPGLGATPARPDGAGASHRVFDAKLAQPPRMWQTHPPSSEREESAKAVYLASALDPRPAWTLFRDPAALRKASTAQLLAEVKSKAGPDAKPPPESAMERFEKRFTRPALDPRYRGTYLRRSVAGYDAAPATMVGTTGATDREGLKRRFERLYPAPLSDWHQNHRARQEEQALLEGLADGLLSAPGGIIRFRGRQLRKRELPNVIATVRGERRDVEQRILDHDRECRAVHRDAARLLGQGWAEHHDALVKLLHYATHAARNLSDAHDHLHHVLGIVFADGSVSNAERKRVLTTAVALHGVLVETWKGKAQVVLPADVSAAFEKTGGWGALDEKLGLNVPTEANLGPWLNAVDSWAGSAASDLWSLVDATLDVLLECEAQLRAAVEKDEPVPPAPTPASFPARYSTCLVGAERERQKRLGWWDRFQTADGVVPGTLRALVAIAVLVPMFFVGGQVARATLHVVNGLATAVVVQVAQYRLNVPPHSARWVEVKEEDLEVVTRTTDGREVERLHLDPGALGHTVYDVAHAVPLVSWSVVYGDGQPPPDQLRGAPSVLSTSDDYFFAEPPKSISTSAGSSETRSVLEAPFTLPPQAWVGMVSDPQEQAAMISAHLRFDPLDDRQLGRWVTLARTVPGAVDALVERAKREPRSVFLARAVADLGTAAQREAVCADAAARAKADPADGDAEYFSIRCQPPSAERDAAFAQAQTRHPKNPWLAFARGMTLAGERRSVEALALYDVALSAKDLAPFVESYVVELTRLRRLAAVQGHKQSPNAGEEKESAELSALLAPERPSSAEDTSDVKAYRALNAGNLDQALKFGASGRSVDAVAALVAASDTATPGDVQRGLAIAPSDVSGQSAVFLAALAVRSGAGASVAKAFLAESPVAENQRDDFLAVLRRPATGSSFEALEAFAHDGSLAEQGQVLAAGLVVWGDKAPAAWRPMVKAMLFADERPYFR
ncbi:MAG: M48 family metalloprotease [Myxococcaceae bacterium]|nr:M48 family metalloprotease [Myxococcaceae bacterium]